MTSFLRCFDVMMKNEGGFQLHHNPADPGGQTYAGIARRRHPKWAGWALIDAGAKDDDPRLPRLVQGFYRQEFWRVINGPELPLAVAMHVFDTAVNIGWRPAVLQAQRTLEVADDADVGPQTVAAAHAADPRQFVLDYNARRLRYYTSLGGWANFGRGWTNRVATMMALGVVDG